MPNNEEIALETLDGKKIYKNQEYWTLNKRNNTLLVHRAGNIEQDGDKNWVNFSSVKIAADYVLTNITNLEFSEVYRLQKMLK
jgi:hypothetical protein